LKVLLVFFSILSATFATAAVPPLGTWEWVRTEESPGVFTTPADVGYTVQFDFNGDMTFTEYRNEEPHESGVFWVTDVEYMGQIITALTFDYGDISPATCAYGIDGEGWLSMWWGANPQNGLPYYPVERYAPRGPVEIEQGNWGSIKALYR
jgi:hypothetical protein